MFPLVEFFETGYYVSACTSWILNGLLFYVILKNTTRSMIPYSRLMLMSVASNIVTSTINFIVQYESVVVDDVIFNHAAAIWIPHNSLIQAISLWIYVGNFCATTWLAPMQGIYRYYMIIKRRTLKNQFIVAYYVVTMLVALVTSMFYGIALSLEIDGQGKYIDKLLQSPIWSNDHDNVVAFIGTRVSDPLFLTFVALNAIVTTGTTAAMVYTSVAVHRHLRKSKFLMTDKTKKMHHEFGIKLLIQSIVPVIVFLLHCFTIAARYMFRQSEQQAGLTLVLLIPFQWVSTVNALIALVCIRAYRYALYRTLFSWICKCKTIKPRNETTFTPIEQRSGKSILRTQSQILVAIK